MAQLAPKGRAALGRPPAETIRHLWHRWLTHAVIDEFSRIEQITGQRARNVLTAAKPRRQTVAVALGAVAVAPHLADSTSVDCPAQALRLYS
jgi:hypothetical protein